VAAGCWEGPTSRQYAIGIGNARDAEDGKTTSDASRCGTCASDPGLIFADALVHVEGPDLMSQGVAGVCH